MSSAGPLVLVADDEQEMRRFLRASLASHGYRVVETESAAETIAQAKAYNPDLVLLDLGLPDLDGLAVISKIREWCKAPVVVISARDREQDKIDALDLGADDYLTKPFGTGELLARMRVALRHANDGPAVTSPSIVVGELRLDVDSRRVFVKDREVHLTPIEYKLFTVLMKNAGKVLTHRQLLKDVWGPSHVDQTQYLRVYMVQLRHKLEEEPARPRYLLTEPGVGYRLREQP